MSGEETACQQENCKDDEGFEIADEESDEDDDVAEEAEDVSLEPEVRLEGVGPVGGIEPERIGADGMLDVGVDGRGVDDELLVMLEVGGGVAEVAAVPLVPSAGVVDEETVVEASGFASGEAATLFGDGEDVRAGDGGEEDASEDRSGENACALG